MQTFQKDLDKHRRIADFDCVGAGFADMQCINIKRNMHHNGM
jgi:hypothetical protein